MYRAGRTFNEGPWHLCMRCDWKWKLDVMTWQRGLLLCPICLDPWPLLGQRELAIAQVLSDGKVDFRVSEKLQSPQVDSEDLLLF